MCTKMIIQYIWLCNFCCLVFDLLHETKRILYISFVSAFCTVTLGVLTLTAELLTGFTAFLSKSWYMLTLLIQLDAFNTTLVVPFELRGAPTITR